MTVLTQAPGHIQDILSNIVPENVNHRFDNMLIALTCDDKAKAGQDDTTYCIMLGKEKARSRRCYLAVCHQGDVTLYPSKKKGNTDLYDIYNTLVTDIQNRIQEGVAV